MVPIAKILEHRPGDAIRTVAVAIIVSLLRHLHEALGLLYRQQPQHDLIEETKHGCVCADTERQCGCRDESKGRILRQRADAEANVLRNPLQQRSGTDVTHALLDLIDSAHFAAGGPIRITGRHSRLHFLCREQLRIGTEFLVQLVIEPIPPEDVVPKRAKPADHSSTS